MVLNYHVHQSGHDGARAGLCQGYGGVGAVRTFTRHTSTPWYVLDMEVRPQEKLSSLYDR